MDWTAWCSLYVMRVVRPAALVVLWYVTPQPAQEPVQETLWHTISYVALPAGQPVFQTHPRYPDYGLVLAGPFHRPDSPEKEFELLIRLLTVCRKKYSNAFRENQLQYLASDESANHHDYPLFPIKYILVVISLSDGDSGITKPASHDQVGFIVKADTVLGAEFNVQKIKEDLFRSRDVSIWDEPSRSSREKCYDRDFRFVIIESHQSRLAEMGNTSNAKERLK